MPFLPDVYRPAVPIDSTAEPIFAALVADWPLAAEADTTVIPLRAAAAS